MPPAALRGIFRQEPVRYPTSKLSTSPWEMNGVIPPGGPGLRGAPRLKPFASVWRAFPTLPDALTLRLRFPGSFRSLWVLKGVWLYRRSEFSCHASGGPAGHSCAVSAKGGDSVAPQDGMSPTALRGIFAAGAAQKEPNLQMPPAALRGFFRGSDPSGGYSGGSREKEVVLLRDASGGPAGHIAPEALRIDTP
jgi:hypothetical protein